MITSVNDGVHTPGGAHDRNEGIDVRTRDNTGKGVGHFQTLHQKKEFHATLKKFLGPRYFVDLEHVGKANEHIHAQLRMGRRWP
jgi:hypothetical protein